MSILSEIVESLTDVEIYPYEPATWYLSSEEVGWLIEAGVRIPTGLEQRAAAQGRKAKRSWNVSSNVEINNEDRIALLRALGFRKGVWGRYRDLVERVYETRVDCPVARARGPPVSSEETKANVFGVLNTGE